MSNPDTKTTPAIQKWHSPPGAFINLVLHLPFSEYGMAALYSTTHHQDKVTVKRLIKAGLFDYENVISPHVQPILPDIILVPGERAAITILELWCHSSVN